MTQQDDSIANRLSRIEARLARIEELLHRAGEEHDHDRDEPVTQEQCYDAWIAYLSNHPAAVETHLSAHEMAALKASIKAPIPVDS